MSEQGANLSLHGIDTNGALPRVVATREIEGRVRRDPDCERLKVIYPWRTQSERRKNVGCERGTRCQAARVPVRNRRVQLQPRRVVSGPGKQEWSRFDSPMIDMCLSGPGVQASDGIVRIGIPPRIFPQVGWSRCMVAFPIPLIGDGAVRWVSETRME